MKNDPTAPAFLQSSPPHEEQNTLRSDFINQLDQMTSRLIDLHRRAVARDLSLDADTRLICIANMIAVLHDMLNHAIRRKNI